MQVTKSTLGNGLRVITVPMPSLESVTLTVWVGTGSRFETPKINGISHFLEHMAFKGSKKRPSAKAISEAVDAIGGEFNAGTNKEWTKFYIKCRRQHLQTAFDVLSDMLTASLLKEADITREKGVIIEEIGLYEDAPMRRVWDIFEQTIYNGNPLGWDIIGSRATVKSLKRTDFVRYINTHYVSKNMLITVAGGVTAAQVNALAEKYLSHVKTGAQEKFIPFAEIQNQPQVKLLNQKREQANFVLGFPGHPVGHKDRYTEAVLSSILGGGMSSRLFTEVREKRGLAYSVKSEVDHALDTGYFCAYAGVDPKRVDEALKVILAEHFKISQGAANITAQELNKAKEYLKGHLALSLEDTAAVNDFYGLEELLLGKTRTPEEVYRAIDAVSTSDIIRVARSLFQPTKLNLALIGPYQDESRFAKLLK